MSEVTGDINNCPRVSDIFFCKYCEYDSTCGEQLKNMTNEEVENHYKKVFSEFDKWKQDRDIILSSKQTIKEELK